MTGSTGLSSTGEGLEVEWYSCKKVKIGKMGKLCKLGKIGKRRKRGKKPTFHIFCRPEKGKKKFSNWHFLFLRDDNSPAPWEEGAMSYPCTVPEI